MNDEPVDVPALVDRAQHRALEIGFAMTSDNRTGSLLRTLAASKPGGRLLEIGTGLGAGAAWLLAGMDDAARLTTIEADPDLAGNARQLLADDHRATVLTADAAEWLASYTDEPFDLVFVDWRTGKFEHRALLLGHLVGGALYVGDDLSPQLTWPDDHAAKVDRFLAEIIEEPALAVTPMDWSSGLVVAARRGDRT